MSPVHKVSLAPLLGIPSTYCPVALANGAVPVPEGLPLVRNPLDGKREEHFFFEEGAVPFPNGTPVERAGTAVRVFEMVASDAAARF